MGQEFGSNLAGWFRLWGCSKVVVNVGWAEVVRGLVWAGGFARTLVTQMAVGRRPQFLVTWIYLCRVIENVLRFWQQLSEWAIRERARWKLQCLPWPQKSHTVIAAIFFWLQRSALFSIGGDYTTVWPRGGRDHWCILGQPWPSGPQGLTFLLPETQDTLIPLRAPDLIPVQRPTLCVGALGDI